MNLGNLGLNYSFLTSTLYAPGPGFLLMTSDLRSVFTILVLGPYPSVVFSTYFPGPTSDLNLASSLYLNFSFLPNVLYRVFGL